MKNSLKFISLITVVLLTSCKSVSITPPSKGSRVSQVTFKESNGNEVTINKNNNPMDVYKYLHDNCNVFNAENYLVDGLIKHDNEKPIELKANSQSKYTFAKGSYGTKHFKCEDYCDETTHEEYLAYYKNNIPTYGFAHFNGTTHELSGGMMPRYDESEKTNDFYMTVAVDRIMYFDYGYKVTSLPEINEERLKYHFVLQDGTPYDFDFTNLVKISYKLYSKYIVLDIKCPIMFHQDIILDSPESSVQYALFMDIKQNNVSNAKTTYYISTSSKTIEYVAFSYEGKDIIYYPGVKVKFKFKYLSKKIDVTRDIENFKELMKKETSKYQ